MEAMTSGSEDPLQPLPSGSPPDPRGFASRWWLGKLVGPGPLAATTPSSARQHHSIIHTAFGCATEWGVTHVRTVAGRLRHAYASITFVRSRACLGGAG